MISIENKSRINFEFELKGLTGETIIREIGSSLILFRTFNKIKCLII